MKRYRVLNAAGGCDHDTDDLELAVLDALDRMMVGSVYDSHTGETIDLSPYALDYTPDGEAFLIRETP